VKKLIGRTGLEDALQRLDKLTHEEVRMATAQVLKATHTVDERVRVVAATVIGVDDRVARVEDTVASVNERVASIDERVKAVDDKVTEVVDGTQTFSVIKNLSKPDALRRKGRKRSHATNS